MQLLPYSVFCCIPTVSQCLRRWIRI